MLLPTRINGPLAIVGDVHGQLDLFDRLLERLRRRTDWQQRWIVLIGDLVDRGPDSRGVIERVLELIASHGRTTAVCGNHDLAMAALRAGKHVLCEKPLAMNLKQAKALAREAKRRKAIVGLWHNYRRCPATSLAKRMIDRGDIGAVRQVRAVYLQDWMSDASMPASWRTDAKICGSGAHGDLNAHLIDMTLFLTGLKFSEVCAVEQTYTKMRTNAAGKRSRVTVDDAFAFLARFSNGAIGTYEATRVAPGRKNHNKIEINGTKGSLVWNFERMNELEFFSFEDAGDAQGFRTIMCMDAAHPYAGNWWPDGHVLGYEHTFVHHLADFVESVASKKAFSPNFEDGARIQAVLDAALKSSATHKWAAVPS